MNERLSYFDYLTYSWKRIEEDDSLNPYHRALYWAIFRRWNQNFFKEFEASKDDLMKLAGIKAENTYFTLISDLVTAQYICFQKGKNHHQKSIINVTTSKATTLNHEGVNATTASNEGVDNSTTAFVTPLNGEGVDDFTTAPNEGVDNFTTAPNEGVLYNIDSDILSSSSTKEEDKTSSVGIENNNTLKIRKNACEEILQENSENENSENENSKNQNPKCINFNNGNVTDTPFEEVEPSEHSEPKESGSKEPAPKEPEEPKEPRTEDPKPKKEAKKGTTFIDSDIGTLETLTDYIKNESRHPEADPRHYFGAVSDWRDKNTGMPPVRLNWKLVINQFFRNDLSRFGKINTPQNNGTTTFNTRFNKPSHQLNPTDLERAFNQLAQLDADLAAHQSGIAGTTDSQGNAVPPRKFYNF